MAMRRPRMPPDLAAVGRRAGRCRRGGFVEPGDENRISPDVMVAVGGRMRMIACAVTDLPEPDSPTSASVEPGSMRNDTRSSAGTLTPRLSNRSTGLERRSGRHGGSLRPAPNATAPVTRGRLAVVDPVDQVFPPPKADVRRPLSSRGAAVHGRLAWLRPGRSCPELRENALTAPFRRVQPTCVPRPQNRNGAARNGQRASGTLRKPTQDLRRPSSRGSVRTARLMWRARRRQGGSLRGGGSASVNSVRSR